MSQGGPTVISPGGPPDVFPGYPPKVPGRSLDISSGGPPHIFPGGPTDISPAFPPDIFPGGPSDISPGEPPDISPGGPPDAPSVLETVKLGQPTCTSSTFSLLIGGCPCSLGCVPVVVCSALLLLREVSPWEMCRSGSSSICQMASANPRTLLGSLNFSFISP